MAMSLGLTSGVRMLPWPLGSATTAKARLVGLDMYAVPPSGENTIHVNPPRSRCRKSSSGGPSVLVAVSSTVRLIEKSDAMYARAPSGVTAIAVEFGLTGRVATAEREAVSMTVSDPFDAAYTCLPSGATASSVGAAPTGMVARTAADGGVAGVVATAPHPKTPQSTQRAPRNSRTRRRRGALWAWCSLW